jgi:predicted phage-related endonuclease
MLYKIYPPLVLVGGTTNNTTVVLEQHYEYDFSSSNLLDIILGEESYCNGLCRHKL